MEEEIKEEEGKPRGRRRDRDGRETRREGTHVALEGWYASIIKNSNVPWACWHFFI